MESYFAKYVDTSDREAMARFLSGHFRYYTANSWNKLTSYANNVKLPNLGLTDAQAKRAYDIMLDGELDMTDYQDHVRTIIDDFREHTGLDIAFNGRSDGYLVLYGGTFASHPYGLDYDELMDPDQWGLDELADETETVCYFDKTCDEIRTAFITMLKTAHVVEEQRVVTITTRRLVLDW